ncbi:hypothetical protein [Clostridium taeniosporum]|uniref:Uncharacterized protein n=1 Tax=Clostridium taeniosporum TaxID=394958 RepID=A0A1D7XLT3_9CLOT|nr:hypothetical protein [Clostridium taeniosporum]AOR24315.1 hypothetical protein BGI42_11470 [Clostridium taeniosporum]
MNKYLWMAVSPDKYELPLIVEETSEKLAKKLNVTDGCIRASEYNHRKRNTGKYNSKCDIRIVKVLR